MALRIKCEFSNVTGTGQAPIIHCAAEKHGGRPTLVQCQSCEHFQRRSKGLGDRVERLAIKTGAKRIVQAVSRKTGKDCGCEKRRRKLNEMFPSR